MGKPPGSPALPLSASLDAKTGERSRMGPRSPDCAGVGAPSGAPQELPSVPVAAMASAFGELSARPATHRGRPPHRGAAGVGVDVGRETPVPGVIPAGHEPDSCSAHRPPVASLSADGGQFTSYRNGREIIVRALKQALLSVTLLLITVVTLNVLRIGRAPAQAPPVIRNGDVDCDGQININDPLLTLNWLFRDGPEPCAIAQENPACCEDLRQQVEALASRVPGPRDIVTLHGEISFPAQGGVGTMFTVPEDKWLVVTQLTAGPGQYRYILDGESHEIKLPAAVANFNRQDIWTTGLALPPGSELILFQDGPRTNPPSPFKGDFYINGYLTGE